jgi:hypothetical protein
VRVRPGIRMEMNIVGLVCASPFIVWMANASGFASVAVAMGLFGFFRGVYDSNQFAAIFDVVSPRYRASAMGLVLAGAFGFAALAPVVLGIVKDCLSMSIGISALAAFFVVGAIVIAVARVCFLSRDYEG